MTDTKELTAKERLKAWMDRHGVTITSTFIPWSQSRNKGEKQRSLNWHVSLLVKGRVVLSTDYSAGVAHCPNYGKHKDKYNERLAIEHETENGTKAFVMGSFGVIGHKSRTPILPDPQDVFWSLLMDASVLDAGGFEEWAPECGYDPDSRKAEAIYRDCLETALKMRNALDLDSAREVCQDY